MVLTVLCARLPEKPKHHGSDVSADIPLAESLHPFPVERETPSSAQIEKVITNLVTIDLSSADNFWYSRTVKQKLHHFFLRVREQNVGD